MYASITEIFLNWNQYFRISPVKVNIAQQQFMNGCTLKGVQKDLLPSILGSIFDRT